MSAPSARTNNVFAKETQQLEDLKAAVKGTDLSKDELKEKFIELCTQHEKLLMEARLLTSSSDRLHYRLNEANIKLKNQAEEITSINEDLEHKNKQLQRTIQLLSKARIEQKAASIVLLLAVALFLLSEGLIEPIIEANTDSIYVGLLLKGVIALLLRPLDIIVERILMTRRLKKLQGTGLARPS